MNFILEATAREEFGANFHNRKTQVLIRIPVSIDRTIWLRSKGNFAEITGISCLLKWLLGLNCDSRRMHLIPYYFFKALYIRIIKTHQQHRLITHLVANQTKADEFQQFAVFFPDCRCYIQSISGHFHSRRGGNCHAF